MCRYFLAKRCNDAERAVSRFSASASDSRRPRRTRFCGVMLESILLIDPLYPGLASIIPRRAMSIKTSCGIPSILAVFSIILPFLLSSPWQHGIRAKSTPLPVQARISSSDSKLHAWQETTPISLGSRLLASLSRRDANQPGLETSAMWYFTDSSDSVQAERKLLKLVG